MYNHNLQINIDYKDLHVSEGYAARLMSDLKHDVKGKFLTGLFTLSRVLQKWCYI